MSSPNHNDFDMDSYVDFNHTDFLSPSDMRSPNLKFSPASIDNMNNFLSLDHPEERQFFPPPTHEYDLFRQQTSLPINSMSNVTAYNDMADGSFNFGSNTPAFSNVNYNTGINLDMDYDSITQEPLPAYFFPGSMHPNSAAARPAEGHRVWPGMHSEAAQRAKAEALAKQQRQQQMGQQIMQQRQQERSAILPSSRQPINYMSSHKDSTLASDPATEERISRLLDQMRQTRAGSVEDADSQDSGDAAIRAARLRKEEEDMDEDERLLASEEGKKLSSKERRQLRNKVSARAFRSRRKEYITQLEGEIAAKVTESNELRAVNRNLMDQNRQLTQLTQTLLRHPAFSTFLNDMSNDPSILATLPKANPQGVPDQKRQVPSQSHDQQINMALMPQGLDMSVLNLGNQWRGANAALNYQQPQVYSVRELPQPSFEELGPRFLHISGKAAPSTEAKSLVPKIERPAFVSQISEQVPSSFDTTGVAADDDSFALYIDSAIAEQPSASSVVDLSFILQSLPAKYSIRMCITRSSPVDECGAIMDVERLFDTLLPLYNRIGEVISHLPSDS